MRSYTPDDFTEPFDLERWMKGEPLYSTYSKRIFNFSHAKNGIAYAKEDNVVGYEFGKSDAMNPVHWFMLPKPEKGESVKFKKYDIVKHRNGGEYGIMRTPEEATYEPTGEPCYIYIDKDMKIWVRPQEQMEDGRFTLLGGMK